MRADAAEPEVALIRWPEEAATRTRLAATRTPRVLVVAAHAEPPLIIDELEDWLREPVDPGDLLQRTEVLRRRAAGHAGGPALDEDGLLRHDGRWVVIPDAQLPVVSLLVERFGKLVRTEDVVAAYVVGGGTANRSSMRTAIVRIRGRVGQVGLDLHAVRRRGFVLEATSTERESGATPR